LGRIEHSLEPLRGRSGSRFARAIPRRDHFVPSSLVEGIASGVI
jgi:hypothetical protein